MRQRFLVGTILVVAMMWCASPANGDPKVVRTISMAEQNAPQKHDQNLKNNTGWHPHNKVGLVEGRFLGVKNNNRALIREADGDVVEVPLFHFTARDLGYILSRMAKFPETILDVARTPDERPIVDLRVADLPLGPLKEWKNNGALGGAFHSMNVPPVVKEIDGRKGVHFQYNRWYIDPKFNAMTSDVLAPKSLGEGKPFTLSAWVNHPSKMGGTEAEALMSWHAIAGNQGTTVDWRLEGIWGANYVAGIGGDLYFPDAKFAATPEWVHRTYVYTGGLDGEYRIYDNGVLKHTTRYDRLPELRKPTEITTDSVTLNGLLNTADGKPAYVVVFIGEFDAHCWMQDRHIGKWEQHEKVGFVNPGKFSAKFKGLRPGTRYYYRMLACADTDYASYGSKQRRWANGVGSFITATEDGKPGKIIPTDLDQHLFVGINWGSRWYTAYAGPSNWFRGYIGDMKLYDRALDSLDVRKEAGLTRAYDAQPANGSDLSDTKAMLSWKIGSKGVASSRVYLSDDKDAVENRTASPKDVTDPLELAVELKPGRVYYWRVDQLDANGQPVTPSDVWSFRVTKGQPFQPFPEDGSTVNLLGDFRWVADGKVKEKRIYIGENKEEVLTSTTPVAKVNRDYNNINILKPGRTYYWRVESVQEDGAVTPGDVWSFTTKNYFTPEADVPVSEPFFEELEPGRPGGRMMEGMGHPSFSTPGADEGDLWAVTHGTNQFLRKSADLRRQCIAGRWGSTVATFEGPSGARGFRFGSYGGIPDWVMQLHEMGHQTHNLLNSITPDFEERLMEVFVAHADNNAWLGDYAACNTGENMAVCTQQFTISKGRESLRKEDSAMYHLLATYLPGDLAIELHPAHGVTVDETDTVTSWANRGGLACVDYPAPKKARIGKLPESIGAFEAVGKPKLETVDGVTAVQFNGQDALLWNINTQLGFQDNRSWSVELWINSDAKSGRQTLIGWGPAGQGARLSIDGDVIEYQLGAGVQGSAKGVSLKTGWHHISCVFEGGGLADTTGDLILYADGKEIYRTKHKLALKPNVKVFIGGDVSDGKVTSGFQGAIAHLRGYNYAIDHEQVENHYADEVPFYQRGSVPNIGGKLYVDIDTRFLGEVGSEYHRPLYSKRMNKPWLRSAANHGTLQGRIHNDIHAYWHYSGSAPQFKKVDGIDAPLFDGMDRMVGEILVKGAAAKTDGPLQGTLEAWVFSDAQSKDEVVLEWGKDFKLTSEHLQPGWQHIALVFNGEVKPAPVKKKGRRNQRQEPARVTGKTTVYRNGKKVEEIDGVLWADDGDYLHLGGRYDRQRWSWRDSFNGAIAAIRLHALPLTAEQLVENYQSDFINQAHSPIPANRGVAVASRKSPLQWTAGLSSSSKEPVSLGTSPDALKPLGSFASGECKPTLAANKTYYWRVGKGPVWSFTTPKGLILDLNAEQLAEGELTEWKSTGTAGGSFTAAKLGTTFAPRTETYIGKTGLNMTQGRPLTTSFDAPACLETGPFTITYTVASTYGFGSAKILKWKNAALIFGQSEKPALTVGNRPMISYPHGNAGLACLWKTFTITYDKGTMKLYQDGRLVNEQKANYSVKALGSMKLGVDHNPRLIGQLQVYSKALSAKEVKAVNDGKSVATDDLEVNVNFGKMGDDEPVRSVANTGKLKGTFGVPAEVDRNAEVKTVNGRKCVAFDGKSMLASDITLPQELADDRPFTLEMWAYSDGGGNSRLFAMNKELTRMRNVSFAFGGPAIYAGGRGRVNWQGGSKMGKWTHLAWVYDGGPRSEIRLYRDGKLNKTQDFFSLDTIAGYPMYLGGMLSPTKGMQYFYKGGIAELKAYDYARTAAEIAKDAKK